MLRPLNNCIVVNNSSLMQLSNASPANGASSCLRGGVCFGTVPSAATMAAICSIAAHEHDLQLVRMVRSRIGAFGSVLCCAVLCM